MAITVRTGVLKEISNSVSRLANGESIATFPYIEFEDGQVMQNVRVKGGLQGKLDSALEESGPIELHMLQTSKKTMSLLAMKTSDGRYFATDTADGTKGMMYAVGTFTALAGLVTIGVFGLGLILLGIGVFAIRFARTLGKAQKHVSSLPNVILV